MDKKLGVAGAALVGVLAAAEARAQSQYVELEDTSDLKKLCVWKGATSDAPVSFRLKSTRDGVHKVIYVESTPGAKVLLSGAYPPDANFEPQGTLVSASRNSARFIHTSHEPVTLDDGTFDVSVIMPLRDGAKRRLKLDCIQRGPGEDGQMDTGDDVVAQKIPLEAELRANGSVQNLSSRSIPLYGAELEGEYPYRPAHPAKDGNSNLDLTLSAGVGVQNAVNLSPEYDDAGYRVTAEFDPTGLQFNDRVKVPLTLQLSGGENRERFTLADGTRPIANVDVHCATVGPSVEWFIQETGRNVSLVIGAGIGLCGTGELSMPVNTPAEVGPVGNFRTALRAGSERFGFQVGADIQTSGDEAFQLWGVNAGAYVRFPDL